MIFNFYYMQKIYHKRNELLKVEFYQDKDCEIPFDFTNVKVKDLYIELKDGDCMPIFTLHTLGSFMIFTPYIPLCVSHEFKYGLINTYIQTLDNITTNLSRYIPEDNAVLFLSGGDCERYMQCFQSHYIELYANDGLDKVTLEESINAINEFVKNPIKKLTIFLSHGTLSELQKANEIAKELKEKYGVEEVNVFVLHCFILKRLLIKTLRPSKIDRMYDNEIYGYKMQKICNNINKVITTNSTGLLEPQDNERLQVIDCFDIFNEALF